MLVQTKPVEAGKPTPAVQFLGDPSVHPMIYHSNDPHSHYRVKGLDDVGGSSYLEIGDYILGDGIHTVHVNKTKFERYYQVIKDTKDGIETT